MSAAPDKNLLLAFAGAFQAATLVRQLARYEHYDSGALHESSFSLLRVEADSVEEIFGSVRSLRLGLKCVANLFGRRADGSAREILQYAIGMYHISCKLQQQHDRQTAIKQGFEELQNSYLQNYRCYDYDNQLQMEIASLYTCHISTMTPRLIIHGEQGRLENPLTINRVRTALFCGIRAAWLWHQLGGRRWQLIFQRNGYQQQAQHLLNNLPASEG